MRMWLERVKFARVNRPYDPFVYGNVVHSIMENAVKLRIQSPGLSVDKVITRAVALVPESIDFDPDTIDPLIEAGLETMEPFIEMARNSKDWGIERDILVDPAWKEIHQDDELLEKEPGAPHAMRWFRGKIDFYFFDGNTLHVFDYKTNRRTKSKDEVFNDPQLRTYAALLSAVLGVRVDVEVHIYFIIHDALVSATYPPLLVEQARNEVNERILAALEAWPDDYTTAPPPTPSWNCSACPFAGTKHCPVDQHPILQAQNEHDHAYLTGQYELHLGLAKLAERQIKEYVATHGPIESGGFRYNYTVMEETDIDGEAIVDVLLNARQSKLLKKIVSVNPAKLKKYLKFAPSSVRHLVRGATTNRREAHFKRLKKK